MTSLSEVKIIQPDDKRETESSNDEEVEVKAEKFLCPPLPPELKKNHLADMSGREVVFALVVLLLVAISLGLSYIIANNMFMKWSIEADVANVTQSLVREEEADW